MNGRKSYAITSHFLLANHSSFVSFSVLSPPGPHLRFWIEDGHTKKRGANQVDFLIMTSISEKRTPIQQIRMRLAACIVVVMLCVEQLNPFNVIVEMCEGYLVIDKNYIALLGTYLLTHYILTHILTYW